MPAALRDTSLADTCVVPGGRGGAAATLHSLLWLAVDPADAPKALDYVDTADPNVWPDLVAAMCVMPEGGGVQKLHRLLRLVTEPTDAPPDAAEEVFDSFDPADPNE